MRRFVILIIVFFAFTLSAEETMVWLTAEPDTIYFDDNLTYSTIQAMVQDENEEPVAGATVYFDSDIGNILHYGFTDQNGIAESTFWESGDLGVATIWAEFSDDYLETEVTIIMPVSADENVIPLITNLTNYPNPFNPSTTILFEISNEQYEQVDITIYNLKGQKVRSFPEQSLGTQDDNNGNYSVIWNGKDDNDKPVASGVYFYQLRSGKINQTRKLMLLK